MEWIELRNGGENEVLRTNLRFMFMKNSFQVPVRFAVNVLNFVCISVLIIWMRHFSASIHTTLNFPIAQYPPETSVLNPKQKVHKTKHQLRARMNKTVTKKSMISWVQYIPRYSSNMIRALCLFERQRTSMDEKVRVILAGNFVSLCNRTVEPDQDCAPPTGGEKKTITYPPTTHRAQHIG